MLLVGLTGSIGMGKSETAKMFARLGVPVCDSDAIVHRLYEKDGLAVEPIRSRFPSAVIEGRVDRDVLSTLVIGDGNAIKDLERIVHPLVAQEQQRLLREASERGAPMAVLDIPLLFETNGRGRVDVVVVVSAPAEVQRKRVLARPGMSADKFEAILAKQWPDEKKREMADFVIDTSHGLDHAEAQVRAIVETLKDRPGQIWK